MAVTLNTKEQDRPRCVDGQQLNAYRRSRNGQNARRKVRFDHANLQSFRDVELGRHEVRRVLENEAREQGEEHGPILNQDARTFLRKVRASVIEPKANAERARFLHGSTRTHAAPARSDCDAVPTSSRRLWR